MRSVMRGSCRVLVTLIVSSLFLMTLVSSCVESEVDALILQGEVPSAEKTENSINVNTAGMETQGIAADYARQANYFFTENCGQFDQSVRFAAGTEFGKAYFFDSKVVYALNRYESGEVTGIDLVTLTFPDSNPTVPTGTGPRCHYSNFFVGDPSRWVTGVQNYRSIEYTNLWDGVDLVYKFTEQRLKYEFVLDPYVPVERIQVGVEGAGLIAEGGSLTFDTGNGFLTDGQLIAKQKDSEEALPAIFVAQGDRFGFNVPQRDILKTLIIDPIVYSTYIDGSASAVDSSGNVYVTGSTNSTDFPLVNPYQSTIGGEFDAFVFKLNPNGSTLLYSTYVGGSGFDGGVSIAVDSSGNAYVAGSTNSTDFPLVNAYQNVYGGGSTDFFVLKLDADGDTLLYSTYIGGNDSYPERVAEIAIDSNGNAYVAGQTDSADFPIANAFQSTFKGGLADAFVLKLNPAGDSLVYSTYIGGSESDFGYSVAVDSSGNAYVVGVTDSTDFPLVDAYQSTFGGNGDAFVLKLNPAGNVLISTYIGGSGADSGYSIHVDSTGNVYLAGGTMSTDFPLNNPFQSVKGGGWNDIFVLKFNPALNALIYSTYIGGNGDFDEALGIAVDSSGNAYVSGYTDSTNFPVSDPFQSTYGGGGDAFILKLNPTGNALLFSTYFGGSDDDTAQSIALDPTDKVYVTGITYSTNFPVYNAYRENGSGWRDGFILKFWLGVPPSIVRNVTATAGNGQVTLNWQAPAEEGGSSITGYNVYRGTSSGGETRLIVLGNVLTYNDTPLTNGQIYYYTVSAINSEGEGPQSDEVWATPVTAPTAPQSLEAAAENNQITLNWSVPANNGGSAITNYKVYRSTTPDGETLLTTLGNVLNFTDTGLTNGQTYYYKVSAVSSAGESALTEEVAATPAAPSPSGGGDMTLIIAIVAVVAIVGVGAAVFYMRKKK